MRRAAGRRITVVAGDIKDDPAMTGWLRAYKREVRGAKVWALHNFKDATSQYTRGAARAFVRMVRGPVWLIETGGIRSRGGLQGQARSVKRNFALAARQPRDQTHLLLRVAGGPPQPLGLRILVGHRQAPPRLPRAAPRPAPPLNQSARVGARYRLVGTRPSRPEVHGPPEAEQPGEKVARLGGPVANESPARPTPRQSPAPGEPARVGSLRPSPRPPGDRPRRDRILAGFSGNTRLTASACRVAPLAHTP
jgi:hypothetical protein